MKLPHAKHPFWTLANTIVAASLIAFIFWCGLVYNNPIEMKDLVTIAAPIFSIGGIDYIRKTFAPSTSEE